MSLPWFWTATEGSNGMGNMGMADSEWHEKSERVARERDHALVTAPTTAELVSTVREALAFDYLGPDSNDQDGEKWGVDPQALAALDALAERVEALERDLSGAIVSYNERQAQTMQYATEARTAEARVEELERALREIADSPMKAPDAPLIARGALERT